MSKDVVALARCLTGLRKLIRMENSSDIEYCKTNEG